MNLPGKLYRIMTEDINRPDIIELTSNLFDGFTMREAIGYWRGIPENSLTVEVITEDRDKVYSLAEAIRVNNKQESVLVETISNHCDLV